MKIYCIATGSKGNCYILENNIGRQIILDAGIPIGDITKSPAFKSFSNIDAVLITHLHKDHSKSMQELENIGLDIYSYNNLNNNDVIKLPNWKIIAFEGKHDCKVLGFVILELNERKIVAYATDTYVLPKIPKIDNWLIECNHDKDYVMELIQKDNDDWFYLKGLLERHLSVQYLEEYFSSDKIKRPNNIITCHLGNCFHSKIEELLSPLTNNLYIAKKGGVYNI